MALPLLAAVAAQVPNRPPNYMMNASTIIMPCNNTGYTDPSTTVGWGVVDFDCASTATRILVLPPASD